MNDVGPGVAIPLIAMVLGLVAIMRGPIGQALARRLEGKRSADPDRLLAEIADLKARVADSEQLHSRIAELEERLDFAERLLARQREPERLKG